MAKYGPDKIRTLALIGHGGSGKTSLAEAILFDTGAISRMGKTDDGTAKTDYDPDEISRHISINAVPIVAEWQDCELNIVDCPGYVDFLPEVNCVLRDMDGAAMVVNATGGCEAQTEKVWEYCKHYGLPVVCFVSKMDKENADFERCLEELKRNLETAFVPLAIPIGAAGSFKGIVDVLARKAYTFSDESGKFTEGPVDSSLEAAVTKYRDALIEAAAGTDDALIEKYLNGEELTEAEILLGLRRGVMERKLVPVVPGSGLRNVGVQHLMETFIRYLPSAQDRKISAPLVGKAEDLSIAPNPSDEVCGHVFKVLVEPHVGDLVIVRMYSGTLTTGAQVLNSTREEREKIGTIQRMRGKDRIEAQELGPGQIGTMLKLKSVRWGDTVATEKRPLRFADPLVPEPYMSAALKPTTTQDGEKLPAALARLRTEDPFIKAEMNDVTHEFVVSGTGELHLDNFVRRLRDRYKVNVDVMKPKIPYRETVRGKAEGQGKHKKQSGGHGQYGDCWLRLEPMPTGGGFEFVDAIVGGKIPNRFIPAVEKGVREALVRGILAGYPVTDLRVTVFEGSYHAVDSSEMAFKTAASKGFKKTALEARPVLMEPVMTVVVTVPESNMGDIMGDLNSRRGRILGMEPDGKKQVIKAQVPLAELYKYIITLRSITGGRGEYTMALSHYEEVPAHVSELIIKDAAGTMEEEED